MSGARGFDPARVAAIVIGRNEGQRLVRCIESVRAVIPNIVYVDSGSRDDSVARARELGAIAIPLESGPYTAARGRQVGLDEVKRRFPDVEFVHFIDGDCILRPQWAAIAVAYLDAHPRVAGVFGRRRETRTQESLLSRMVDLEWEMPAGPVICHGGDAMDRVRALDEVGGWSIDLIAGEDPDLGFRLRDKGWEIHCLREEMTGHDIAMKGFGAYWKRAVRSGHAYAEVGWRGRRGAARVFLKRSASILFYGLFVPLLALVLAILYWPALVLPLVIWTRLVVSLAWYTRRRGYGWGLSAVYALTTSLCKIASAIGVLRFVMGQLTGKRSRIIEYKGPVAQAGG